MRVWLQMAWICVLAVGCGGPLLEESPPEEASHEEASDDSAPGEVSAQWNRTRLGTPYLVEDIFPPPPPPPPPPFPIQDPLPGFLVDFRGRLFFAANIFGEGALWRSDGTAPGTFAVRDFGADSSVESLTVVGNRLFFIASEPAHGAELWVTDGTSGGTRLVRDISPGPTSSGLGGFTRVGDTLFFYRHLRPDPIDIGLLERWNH